MINLYSVSNKQLNNKNTLSKKNLHQFLKNHLMFPSILHSTLTSAWLGSTIGLSADRRSVRITRRVKQAQ